MKRNTVSALLVILGSFLVLFQARWGVAAYGNDESCYLEWLHRFIGSEVPMCYSHSHPWGVSLLWVPMGLIAKGLAGILHANLESILLPLVGLFSFACWGLSLILLHKVILIRNPHFRFRLTALLFFCIPVINYVFRYPFFAHSGELLLTVLSFYFLLTHRPILACLIAVWLCFTRPYDALIAGVVMGYALDSPNEKLRRPLRIGATVLAAAALFLFVRIGFFTGYHGLKLVDAFHTLRWLSLERILFGFGGLVWWDAWCLFLLALGMTAFRRLSWMDRASWAWLLALFLLHINPSKLWDELQPRYLIGAYVGAILLFARLEPTLPARWRRVGLTLASFQAVSQLYLFWTTPYYVLRHFGPITDTVDPTFAQLALLLHPWDLLPLAGLSPVPFTLFSWLHALPMFQRFANYGHYALKGPTLLIFTAFVALTLIAFLHLLRCGSLRHKTRSPLVDRNS
ncbi:MAG: hypothetical protein HYR96_03790 [Deltaproteobacteria bacterium]|nr:hypothetical protein [Deltaproteobacteria bacterium]